jgi:uncharacterized protein
MKWPIIIVVILIGISIFFFYFNNDGEDVSVVEDVCFKETCFDIEVVDTPEARQQGLMFRENLPAGSGMLFIFDGVGVYPFWMKNTLIPLDIIWINSNKKVVHVANAVPCVEDPCEIYNPNAQALYVLEVNAGVVDEIGLELGDTIKFK